MTGPFDPDREPHEEAVRSALSAAEDNLTAEQPPVTDWPGVVWTGVVRRRMRRTVGGVLTATAVLSAAGAIFAVPRSGPESLVAAPPSETTQASPTATPAPSRTPAPDEPTTQPTPGSTRVAPVGPATSPSAATGQAPSAPVPPPSAQPLQSCGAASAPTGGDVRLTLDFPAVVRGVGAEGTATLTNNSDKPIQVQDRQYAKADASRDGRIVSAGGGTADAPALVTIEPGQSRNYRVVFPTTGCGSGEPLPPGSYEVAADVLLQGGDGEIVSNYVQVTFQS